MPSIVPRQRVNVGGTSPAPSTGAALGSALASAGSALLGQQAEQKFERDEFEIKVQERRQANQAIRAMVEKNSARIEASQQIRQEANPEEYIDRLNEWEDKYDEDLGADKSEFFRQIFQQRDMINRVNAAKSMGTAMRSDLLDETLTAFEGDFALAEQEGDLQSIKELRAHWRDDNNIKGSAVEERYRKAKKVATQNMLMAMDTDKAISQLGDGMPLAENFSASERENMLRTLNSKVRRERDMASIMLIESGAKARNTLSHFFVTGANYEQAMQWIENNEDLTPFQRKDAIDFVNSNLEPAEQVSPGEISANNALAKGTLKESINRIKFDMSDKGGSMNPNNSRDRENVLSHMESLESISRKALSDFSNGKIDRTTYYQILLDANSMMGQLADTMKDANWLGNVSSARVLSDKIDEAVKGLTLEEEASFKGLIFPAMMTNENAYIRIDEGEANSQVDAMIHGARASVMSHRNPGNTKEENEKAATAMAQTNPSTAPPRQQVQEAVNASAKTPEEAKEMAQRVLPEAEAEVVAQEWKPLGFASKYLLRGALPDEEIESGEFPPNLIQDAITETVTEGISAVKDFLTPKTVEATEEEIEKRRSENRFLK